MTTPNRSMSQYLKEGYEKFSRTNFHEGLVHLVLGNQSADMDSIVSALAFAYANRTKGFYIPMINIPSIELRLRKDVIHVLNAVQIDPKSLLYRNHMQSLRGPAIEGKLRVTLVDHNRLAPTQDFLHDCVEEIIDHHEDTNIRYTNMVDEKKKKVMRVGSNATLITDSITQTGFLPLSQEGAYLLKSAILLDTGNLKKKVEPLDEEMLKKLNQINPIDNQILYKTLMDLRMDNNGCSTTELLNKDFKTDRAGKLNYGIAVVKGETDFLNQQTKWVNAFHDFFEELMGRGEKLDLISALLSLTISGESGKKKFWVTYAKEETLQNKLREHQVLGKRVYKPLSEGPLTFFQLEGMPSSRKDVQPILHMYLEDI